MEKGLKEVDFTPKDDVEDYLCNRYNLQIFKELEIGEFFNGQDICSLKSVNGSFKPLDFFNLFYGQLELVKANINKPRKLIEHFFYELGLSQGQLHYFWFHLIDLLIREEKPDSNFSRDDQFLVSLDAFIEEFDLLNLMVYEYSIHYDHYFYEPGFYNDKAVKNHLYTLPDTLTKTKYLVEIKTECERARKTAEERSIEGFLFEGNKYDRFLDWCDLEIHKYKEILELEGNTKTIAMPSNNTPSDVTEGPLTFSPEAPPAIEISTGITISREVLPQVFMLLKDYFSKEKQEALRILLEEGNDTTTPLVYLRPANGLCDFFLQLYSGQFLKATSKASLEQWISRNFTYWDKNKKCVKTITPKYAARYISERGRPAKGNRLIDIREEDGKNIIVQLKLENRQRNNK